MNIDVKSAWLSKINWTQAIGVLASILVVFGINLDTQTQVAIVAGIQGVVAFVTWVMRTFFTTSLTPSSAAKL